MAAGGVERIAIVAAALLIVFWGYKLYAGGLRNQREAEGPNGMQDFVRSGTGPGILFMGIGCTVLIITLMTGGTHLESAGEAYRSAGSVGVVDIAPQPAPVDPPSVTVSAPAPAAATPPAAKAALDLVDAEPTAAPDAAAAAVVAEADTAEPSAIDEPAEVATVAESAGATESAGAAEDADEALDFANSRELGGRIVSVKSERATLQWSGDGE